MTKYALIRSDDNKEFCLAKYAQMPTGVCNLLECIPCPFSDRLKSIVATKPRASIIFNSCHVNQHISVGKGYEATQLDVIEYGGAKIEAYRPPLDFLSLAGKFKRIKCTPSSLNVP